MPTTKFKRSIDIADHGTTVNSEALGLKLAGTLITASPAEINSACTASTRVVNATASTLTVTAASHANKIVTLNRAAGIAVTLPNATGTGNKYTFIIGTTVTSNTTVFSRGTAADVMIGTATGTSDDPATVKGWIPAANSNTITFNGTTTFGYIGDKVELTDLGTNLWDVRIVGKQTGTEATPFSNVP